MYVFTTIKQLQQVRPTCDQSPLNVFHLAGDHLKSLGPRCHVGDIGWWLVGDLLKIVCLAVTMNTEFYMIDTNIVQSTVPITTIAVVYRKLDILAWK